MIPAPTFLKVAIIAGAQWFACGGCSPNQPHPGNVVVDQHGGYGEPRIALLSCGRGFVLQAEFGQHSAKAWCVSADGGVR